MGCLKANESLLISISNKKPCLNDWRISGDLLCRVEDSGGKSIELCRQWFAINILVPWLGDWAEKRLWLWKWEIQVLAKARSCRAYPSFTWLGFLSIQRKVTSCWWSLSECISIIFLLSALQLQNLANTKILITPFNAIHIPWLNTPSHYVQLDFAMVALGFQKSPAEAHSIARHGRTRVDKGHSAIDTIIDDGTVMFISCFWFECRVAKCWTINRTQIAERLSYMALIPDLPLCYLRRGQSSWSDLREAIVHGVWFNVAQLTTAWKIFNVFSPFFKIPPTLPLSGFRVLGSVLGSLKT